MMGAKYLLAGLMASILTMGCVITSQAQVTGSSSSPSPSSSPSSAMAAPTIEPMTDQVQTVSYKRQFLFLKSGQAVGKTITLQPGTGEISLDGLRRRGEAQLTLVNPSATPLQFETIGRSGGQKMAVIPAHSQKTVSFEHKNGNDIKFFVMQQPDNAIATNQDYATQQAAAVATEQNVVMREALDQQTAAMSRSQDSQTAELKNYEDHARREAMYSDEAIQRRQERRSAVRGFW
jgi:hypothetical protein